MAILAQKRAELLFVHAYFAAKLDHIQTNRKEKFVDFS
jgi:hypothetical protein